nr:protein WHAT'S THIS FACTOR 9, mitochondrial [Ipomoea batatas]
MLKRGITIAIARENYTSTFSHHQKRTLVNAKVKWVKDSVLDRAVAGGRELKAASILLSLIGSDPQHWLPIYHLRRHRGQLGLPLHLKLSAFLRRYPTIFQEFYRRDTGGTPVPCFRLTSQALELHQEEAEIRRECHTDIVNRLRKLLMLTKERMLPLQTLDQLKWDIGLPSDYQRLFTNNSSDLFSFVRLSDDRVGLKLLLWDDCLAVSHLEMNSVMKNGTLAFPIGFPRGFGLKRKFMEWLEEWQKLPYTSPFAVDLASRLDPRTDVSEKRIVGVFHELLHLTLQKKTERKNVSNLRKPLGLPQKFTKVFERHPGIFYISKKGDTQTVVLREAYDHSQLIEKHPLVGLRDKLASIMNQGFLDRSRGLYSKETKGGFEQDSLTSCFVGERTRYVSDEDSDFNLLSEYESD